MAAEFTRAGVPFAPSFVVQESRRNALPVPRPPRVPRIEAALCDGLPSLEGRRIALLATPGTSWVEGFLGILLAGGVALPLSPLYPPSDLAWFAEDAGRTR